MLTTRLSTKGQIILPKNIRVSRAWAPGMKLTVEETDNGVILRPASRFPPTQLDDVVGLLGRLSKRVPKGPKNIAEMDDAITLEVKQRHERGRY
jgi:AbrB family looped-hinge helix DNA binding protein